MTVAASLCLLVLAVLGSAEVVNQLVDQQLSALNALNGRNELGLLELSPRTENGTDWGRGYLLGVPSLERAGDAVRDGERYRVPLRLGLLVLGFGRVVPAGGPEVVLSLSLPNNSLLLDFSLGPDCRPRVHRFGFTDLGEPALQARPVLSQAQGDLLVRQLWLFFNDKLKGWQPQLATHLQIFCW